MASNDDELGTNALRLRMAGARAQGGAVSHAPAPPPDRVASPWADFAPPGPERLAGQAGQAQPKVRKVAAAVRPKVEAPKEPPKRKESTHDVRADQLVNAILNEWASGSKRGMAKANVKLGNQLMRNGAILIQHGYPIGTLGELIRISTDLTREHVEDTSNDKRIDDIRKSLTFDDGENQPAENADASAYPETETEDEDEEFPE